MTLTRRTLLQSLAALFPLTALGLGRAPNLSGPLASRLPEPAGGGKHIVSAIDIHYTDWDRIFAEAAHSHMKGGVA